MLKSFLSRAVALVCLVTILNLATSCEGKEEPQNTGITIDPVELQFSEQGGSHTVAVNASGTWTASVPGNWVKLSAMSGSTSGEQITVTVEPNLMSPKERVANVVFSSQGKSATLTVSQSGADVDDPSLPATVFEVNFLKASGGFTIENKRMPSELKSIWISDERYGMKASARVNDTNYDSESWLISPEIDLSARHSAYLKFSHVYQFCTVAVADQLQLKITSDGGQNWADVAIPKWPSGNNWTFVNSGDIDLKDYCGKKIKIAFVYKSTKDSCPTWEIASLSITREPSAASDTGQSYKGTPAWLELPRIKNGEKFIIHSVKNGTKNLRNYSLVFDTEALVAPWIAYPLCDSYTSKNVDRTDAWGPDPFLSEKEQPILAKSGDFIANGFERGHQIASADRLASTSLNEQTFYYSNMAPMYAGANFNSGVWSTIEDKCRSWSRSSNGTDTLYVVTGCVTKGSSMSVKDNNGKSVTVPKYFYKVLLRYSKNSKENGGYSGIAFYVEHKKYTSASIPAESIYSIDAIEDILGIDFFPNLEDKIGKDAAAKVEAESPIYNSFWGF